MDVIQASIVTTYIFQDHLFPIFIIICLIIVLAFPNTQSIYEASNDIIFKKKKSFGNLTKILLMIFLSALFLFSMMSLNNNKIFLYYQF